MDMICMAVNEINMNVFAPPISHDVFKYNFALINCLKKWLSIFRTPSNMQPNSKNTHLLKHYHQFKTTPTD